MNSRPFRHDARLLFSGQVEQSAPCLCVYVCTWPMASEWNDLWPRYSATYSSTQSYLCQVRMSRSYKLHSHRMITVRCYRCSQLIEWWKWPSQTSYGALRVNADGNDTVSISAWRGVEEACALPFAVNRSGWWCVDFFVLKRSVRSRVRSI